MALTCLNPLTFEAFVEVDAVRTFHEWVLERVGGADLGGWRAAGERYRWSGYDLELTLECRRRQSQALHQAGADEDKWRLACEHVREWAGSTSPYAGDELQRLRGGCELLGHEPIAAINGLYVGKPSTTSKVYPAFYPDRWITHDSRVGMRLACLVKEWWAGMNGDPGAGSLRFPVPPGRRDHAPLPNGFHVLGSDRQARLAFLYASWLCRLIAECLNARQAPLPTPADAWTPQDGPLRDCGLGT